MRIAISLALIALVGCDRSLEAGSPDSSVPPDMVVLPDLTAPFPATSPDVPQIQNLGGPVLKTAQVVAITFPNDELQSDIETFVSTVGATPYWNETTSEYGVGALTALTPVHLTEMAPSTIDDTEIQTWLAGKLDGTHPEFPAASGDTIYTIFYPASTTITEAGQSSCQAFGGYHNDARVGLNKHVPYAVLPRCSDTGISDLDMLTVSASHELIEAATDPLPTARPAYAQLDDAHFVWSRFTGGEAGDMCENDPDSIVQPDGFPYVVQRTWSNAAAAAGKAPCVPAVKGTYFNATPTTTPNTITLNTSFGSFDSEGWTIPVGTSQTIQFTLYSDGPSQPWSVGVRDLARQPVLSFHIDQTSGSNGDKVNITVTTNSDSTSRLGADIIEITSTLGQRENSWIGLVSTSAQ